MRPLFWLYLLVLVVCEATSTNPADPDLWHRLAVGEYLWKTGHFPLGDTFSYLADYRDIADHEWGSAVIFYGAYAWAGGGAIVAIKIVTLGLTLVLLAAAGMRGRAPTLLFAAFYALVLLAVLPSFQSTVRCMVFTNLFFALWLYWYRLEEGGKHPVPLWAYALTMVVWANLHGGFAIGLLWLFGVTAVKFGEGLEWKRPGLRFLVCSLATLLNPFGWRLWTSTARALVTTRTGFDEWEPVSWWRDPVSYPGYKLLVCVTVVALALHLARRGWRNGDRPGLIFIAAALILSFVSSRHTALFAAVAGAFLPSLLMGDSGETLIHPLRRLELFAVRFALVMVPLLAALRALPGDGLELKFPAISCPVRAVDFLLRNNVRGNLLVPFNYGSYALWELRGRMRVSMDGRYDLLYLPATYRRVDDFFFARGDWQALLYNPAAAAVLLPQADPVYARLKALPGWAEAYHDDTDAIFIRVRKKL